MSDAFHIQPLARFQGSSAAIRRPKEIACFSYDEDHKYHYDDRSLRYYYPPRIGADLSKGFDTFRQLDDTTDDHLDSLLEAIVTLEKETGSKCHADIITWRGMMTKIMSAPYDNMSGNGFEMNATFFQGTIFIEENHAFKITQRASQRNQPARSGLPSQDLMSFWGYKFESLCLLPDIWHATSRDYIESREDHIVSNHAQYCSIVKTGIGTSRLILGGEVDAVWDQKPAEASEPANWVELKTSASIQNDRDMLKYERKLLKFWVQSFLLGVPRIVVGFRSKFGILEGLEDISTVSIPNMVKTKGKASWDGNLCINYMAAFLEWLKNIIQTEGVWRIRRRDNSTEVEVFQIEGSGTGRIISETFRSWREQLADAQRPKNSCPEMAVKVDPPSQ